MLPFLKKSQEAGPVSMSEPVVRDSDGDFDSMEVAAQDVMDAVHSKNVKALASALRAAFELADSEPHEEGPHE